MAAKDENFWKNRIVLVTGGAGAIGWRLVHRLQKEQTCRIIILDDLSQSFVWRIPSSPNVHFIHGSVADEKSLRDAFEEQPTIVFHLAALFANQHSIDDPVSDLVVNGLGTLKLLRS